MNRPRQLWPSPSYANVVATLALVIAVSGGATAIAVGLGKGSVTTKTIKNGAIRGKKLGPIVIRSASGPGIGQARVQCAKGERVMGGGGAVDGGAPDIAAVRKSYPDGNGWYTLGIQGTGGGGGPITVRAYAVCLKK
jgi:hypothetical protein